GALRINNSVNFNSINAITILPPFGNIGLGITQNLYKLDVNGTAHKQSNTTGWDVTSDRRLKTDIESLHGALALLNEIRPVSFHYTAKNLAEHPGLPATKQFGVIAQEYQKVFPDFVSTNSAGYLTVDSSPLTFHNTAAIQELAARLEKLERRE